MPSPMPSMMRAPIIMAKVPERPPTIIDTPQRAMEMHMALRGPK